MSTLHLCYKIRVLRRPIESTVKRRHPRRLPQVRLGLNSGHTRPWAREVRFVPIGEAVSGKTIDTGSRFLVPGGSGYIERNAFSLAISAANEGRASTAFTKAAVLGYLFGSALTPTCS